MSNDKTPPQVLDPVSSIPPISRQSGRRESKYDPVLDKAIKLGSRPPKDRAATPVQFRSRESAAAGRRRIMDRVMLHPHTDRFTVEQRDRVVYVEYTP